MVPMDALGLDGKLVGLFSFLAVLAPIVILVVA
jgi:hypothetical protein